MTNMGPSRRGHKILGKILTTKNGMDSQLFPDFLTEQTNERKIPGGQRGMDA